MLRLSVRPDTVTGLTRLELTDVYLSPDLSFMSATTSHLYNIKNGDKVVVTTPDGGQQECRVEAWNEKRQGYANCTEKVERKVVTYHNPNNDGHDGKEVNYIIYNGQVCYELNGSYFVDGEIIEPEEDEDGKLLVTLAKKRWIDNSYLNVGEHSYEVNMDMIGGPTVVYVPDGEPVTVNEAVLWPQKDWFEVTKIIIRRNPDQQFDVDAVSCGVYYPYIEIGGNIYDLEPLYDTPEDGCDPITMSGYGFVVDGVQYTHSGLTYTDEYGSIQYREPVEECYINIGGQEVKVLTRIMATTEGDKLILYTDDHSVMSDGDKIIAQSTKEIAENFSIHSVNSDLSDPYIVYGSNKCPIKECLFDTVDVGGTTYDIIYPEGETPAVGTIVEVHEESAVGNYFHAKITEVSSHTVTVGTSTVAKEYPSKLIRYYKDKQKNAFRMVEGGDSTVEYKEHQDSEAYEITHNDGVYIEDRWHIIESGFCRDIKIEEGITLSYHEVSALTGENDGNVAVVYYESDYTIPVMVASKYELDYMDYDGASMVICQPSLSVTQLEYNEMMAENRRICSLLTSMYDEFSFSVKNRVFGNRPITPEVEIDAAVWATDIPVNSGFRFDPSKDIQVHKIVASLLLKVPMAQETALNLRQEDILTNTYAKEKREESINRIVDMEHEVYYPMEVLTYNRENGAAGYEDENNYFLDLREIKEIRLNFHFRTRQPESWKVIEDQRLNEAINGQDHTKDTSNWFVTDYYPYCDENLRRSSGDTLQASSDLMGLLGFTDDDIFYQKTKVGKSFARISIYDSMDPFTQSLLHMSSVFMDEGLLFKKFIENRKNGQYLNVSPSSQDMAAAYSSATISVGAEAVSDVTNLTSVTMDDSTRLSSGMVIRNKYATETSSEGYYLYMFKEYVDGLHPKSVYMRIDFNHAGFGRTIPMILPLAYNQNGERDHILRIQNGADLDKLKEGVPLHMLQQQLYIQLICQYDRKNHKYVYYLPELYESCVSDGVMTLNLFELKIMNEATEQTS